MEFFFPDTQSHFVEGISLQDVFSFEICTIIFFFSEITHTPPQKSNGRRAAKFDLLILSETENGIKSFS